MSVRSLLTIFILTFAACGGDDGGDDDNGPGVDAQISKVMAVTCPATTPVTFTTRELSFNPGMASITVGQTVKFESTISGHPIGPIQGSPQSDPGLVVPGGQTKCFTFLEAGTFRFQCTQHGYAGMLTVN